MLGCRNKIHLGRVYTDTLGTEPTLGLSGQAGEWAAIRDILDTALTPQPSSFQLLCLVATQNPVQTEVPLDTGTTSIGWGHQELPHRSRDALISVSLNFSAID